VTSSPRPHSLEVLPSPETHIYKIVDDLEIKADVYRANDSPTRRGTKRPAVIWFHGGALISGFRTGFSAGFLDRLLEQDYVVVSVDYRLAPETKLPAIIDDVRDAYTWVRSEGPELFGVDPDRIAAAGASAGGYLALMTGFCLSPGLNRGPCALVSFCGYGDLTAPWLTRLDEFYRQQPLISEAEAFGFVGTEPVSDPAPTNQRGRFYRYCRQQGVWHKHVAGRDAKSESEWFDPYCPIRNVTASYPPAFLIHGTADTDVPYDESRNMAARLAECRVEHELLTLAGVDHLLKGAKLEEVENANSRAIAFLKAHLD
jgi:acetyl esterase/lipase